MTFYFLRDPNKPNDNLLLCGEYPYIVVRVWLFENAEGVKGFLDKPHTLLAHHKIDGYNILVVYAWELEGEVSTRTQIETTLTAAAAFYHQHRIKPKEKYYSKYRDDE